MPPAEADYFTIPNVIRTRFTDEMDAMWAEGALDSGELREHLIADIPQDRLHELTSVAGQSAGLIHDLLGAADIIGRIVLEAETALSSTFGVISL